MLNLELQKESYAWEDIYTTEDNSTVFSTRDIEVEFFNLDQPLNRECSVLYAENGNSQILYL